jgi:A/G-specific adenine glycosylase
MKKFPTIASVAQAPLEDLIKAWEGLGYYSRVKNIKKGAIFLHSQGKDIPSSSLELLEIPGIGPYTAGAIASFAFHRKAAAVDGNVKRVISRYYGIEDEPSLTLLEEKTLSFLSDETPWIQMEALIELGATLCQKKASCSLCPLQKTCVSYLSDKTAVIPKPKKRPSPIYQQKQIAIILWDERVVIEKREEGKVLAGLMEFPSFDYAIDKTMEERIMERFSLQVEWSLDLPVQKQSFTKYQLELFPAVFRALDIKETLHWEHKDLLQTHTFSSGHKRVLKSFLDLS